MPVGTSLHSLAVHLTRPLVANVNYDAASVTMIDTNTDKVVATIAVGKNPQDVAWAPTGASPTSPTSPATACRRSTPTMTVTATILTGRSPTSIAILPDGSRATSAPDDGTLTLLNLAG